MKSKTRSILAGIIVAVILAIAGGAGYVQSSYPQYNATLPTYVSGFSSVMQTDSHGRLLTQMSGDGVGSLPLLAASQLGNVSGTYISGAHKIALAQSDNSSATTVYCQIYDATSQPANGTVPVEELLVPFGISNAPSSNRLQMNPGFISVSTGVWYCFTTAPGAFNSANLVGSGSGLLVRIYGQ